MQFGDGVNPVTVRFQFGDGVDSVTEASIGTRATARCRVADTAGRGAMRGRAVDTRRGIQTGARRGRGVGTEARAGCATRTAMMLPAPQRDHLRHHRGLFGTAPLDLPRRPARRLLGLMLPAHAIPFSASGCEATRHRCTTDSSIWVTSYGRRFSGTARRSIASRRCVHPPLRPAYRCIPSTVAPRLPLRPDTRTDRFALACRRITPLRLPPLRPPRPRAHPHNALSTLKAATSCARARFRVYNRTRRFRRAPAHTPHHAQEST